MRRAVALEYGLPLSTLTPRKAFLSRITEETDAGIYTQAPLTPRPTAPFQLRPTRGSTCLATPSPTQPSPNPRPTLTQPSPNPP
eukprot:4304535-Prymnesium_polylepis.1